MFGNRFTQFLLNLTPRLGLTDNALAHAIDITPQAISKFRKKGSHMSDRSCLAVSALLGVQAQIALILLYADRTPDPAAARLLQDAACVLMMCYMTAFDRRDGVWQAIGLLLPVPSKLDLAPPPRPRRKGRKRRKLARQSIVERPPRRPS